MRCSLEDNQVGAAAAVKFAVALRHNTTLRDLKCVTVASWGGWLTRRNDYGAVVHASDIRLAVGLVTGVWCSLQNTEIGDPGGRKIAEALRHNATLESLVYVVVSGGWLDR